jgi:hypothetical protein
MKTRIGFVSNSSSSSFCILGVTDSQIGIKDFNNNVALRNEIEDRGLSYTLGLSDYYDDYVIGLSIEKLDPDKTINESKRIVAEKLSTIFEKEITMKDISILVDGGMDN